MEALEPELRPNPPTAEPRLKIREKRCGTDTPPDFVSLQNKMALKFYSDTSVNRKGFKLQYQSQCGGNLTGMASFDFLAQFDLLAQSLA